MQMPSECPRHQAVAARACRSQGISRVAKPVAGKASIDSDHLTGDIGSRRAAQESNDACGTHTAGIMDGSR